MSERPYIWWFKPYLTGALCSDEAMTLSALLAKLGSKRLDLFLTSLHALESEAGTVCEASPTKAMFDRAALSRLVVGRGLA